MSMFRAAANTAPKGRGRLSCRIHRQVAPFKQYPDQRPCFSRPSIAHRTYASLAPAPASPPSEPIPVTIADENPAVQGAVAVLPLLQKVRQLLQNDIGGDSLWVDRIDAAIADLRSQRRGRIGVIGDAYAAPRDVVSALLQDPLADSAATRQALVNRHADANIDVFEISQGELLRNPESLSLTSSWLQATGYDVVEISSKNLDAPSIESNLLSTDAIIVVVDPVRLALTPQLSPIIPSILARSPVHFVINGHLPPNSTPKSIEATLREQLGAVTVDPLDGTRYDPSSLSISFIEAEKALHALEALSVGLGDTAASPSSRATAVETFQREFNQSHIGPLQAVLHQTLASRPFPQVSTAHQTVSLAINHISNVILADREIARSAAHTVTELERSAQQGATKAKHLSVAMRGIDSGLVEGGVEYEMSKIKSQIEDSFRGRLSWLGLLGRLRVDDVALELGGFVGNRFAVDLERQVVFETGQLSHLQTALSSSVDQTLRQLSHPPQHLPPSSSPHHPFTSPLLANHLSTLSLSIPPLSPTSLLYPIATRRNQLLAQSIPKLQFSAQRALLTTYSTALLGVSASWVAYVPPIEMLSAGTAGGLGLLSIVSSVAVGQKLWGRAQKKFWRDWKRVTAMLKGDLQTRLDTALQTQVIAKPLAAAQGLEKLIERRKARLDDLQSEVDKLKSQL